MVCWISTLDLRTANSRDSEGLQGGGDTLLKTANGTIEGSNIVHRGNTRRNTSRVLNEKGIVGFEHALSRLSASNSIHRIVSDIAPDHRRPAASESEIARYNDKQTNNNKPTATK